MPQPQVPSFAANLEPLPNSLVSSSSPPRLVKQAVILAAGHGERIRSNQQLLPKPLIVVGGLRLIERSILSLAAAGIERFRVVVGAHKEEVITQTQALKSLKNFQIEFIECLDFERGNGMSLAAGSTGLREPFLVTMADHIFTVDMIKSFMEQCSHRADDYILATDPRIQEVFDLEDATKVFAVNGRIEKIGKSLTDYNEIDTGLFFFPASASNFIANAKAEGATSVSEIVARINGADGFKTIALSNANWQDVDNASMRNEAEKRLMKSLIKPTDGPVSKALNRKLSTRTTRYLVRWGISPSSVTTFVFFLSIYGAYLAASGNYLKIAIGAVLFQIASILDGCDGEIARLTFKGSRFGAWYDTITDNIRYGIFFCCLGFSGYVTTGSTSYLWAILYFSLLQSYFVTTNTRYVLKTNGPGTFLMVTSKVTEHSKRESRGWWDRFIIPLRFLIKQDVSALIVMFFCLASFYTSIFWISCLGLTAMAISSARALKLEEDNHAEQFTQNTTFVFYVLGFTVLAYLFSRMPYHEIHETLSQVGLNAIYVFLIAPIWMVTNTLSLARLTSHRVPFIDLLHNNFVGESLNAVIPLAGMAGEPFKVRHLSQWMPMPQATKIILQDKLIHMLGGTIFTAVTCALTLMMLDTIGPKMTWALWITTGLMSFLSVIVAAGVFTNAPSRLLSLVLHKLKLLDRIEHSRLKKSTFLVCIGLKLLSRSFMLIEAYVLFRVLSIQPQWSDLVAVGALVSTTATLFFVIPQGLGVNEAGIAGAFSILGYSTPMGMAFGIIRRARMIFWAMIGVCLQGSLSALTYLRGARNLSDSSK